jgi:hypothetical protein
MQVEIEYAEPVGDERLMEFAFDPRMANQTPESRSVARELIEARRELKRIRAVAPPINTELLRSILSRHEVEYVALQRDGQLLRYRATAQFQSLLDAYCAYRDAVREVAR